MLRRGLPAQRWIYSHMRVICHQNRGPDDLKQVCVCRSVRHRPRAARLGGGLIEQVDHPPEPVLFGFAHLGVLAEKLQVLG